ncbi:DUF1707 domain-containing protein [Sphaerisporangium sp. NPDC049002]|uniref:DUF1707 SHOCT-like domain-containing protein n=1 Tax=unclassified Sphaerisporangium TaxID=2630420 RepID=UPI0034119986
MTSRDDLRIGDAERDEVMTALREHFAQGRLTHAELDERLDTALAARTASDLRQMTADLPGPASRRPVEYARPRADGWTPPQHADLASWGHHMAYRAERAAARRERFERRRGRHGGPPVFLFVLAFILIASVVTGLAGPLLGLVKVLFFVGLAFTLIRLAHHRHHLRHPRLGRRR